MIFALYLNLAWQTAVLTILGYVAWWAYTKIRFFLDVANMKAAIIYTLVFLLLLVPPSLVFGAGFVNAIRNIFLSL